MAWVMHISPRGIALIKEFEALRLKAYQCSAGRWTIGYGTTTDEHGQPIKPGTVISQAEAEALLVKDLDAFERNLNRLVTINLTQNQFDALMVFVYNIGLGAFEASTLLKLLNRGNTEGASNQFERWNKVRGKPSAGLTRRREAERKLFMEE